MKKMMILLAAMMATTLVMQANEAQPVEITVTSMDADSAVAATSADINKPTEDDKNTTEEEAPKAN